MAFRERVEPLQSPAARRGPATQCRSICHGISSYLLQLPGEIAGSRQSHLCCLIHPHPHPLCNRRCHRVDRLIDNFIDLTDLESATAANCLPNANAVSRIKLSRARFLLDDLWTIEPESTGLGAY